MASWVKLSSSIAVLGDVSWGFSSKQIQPLLDRRCVFLLQSKGLFKQTVGSIKATCEVEKREQNGVWKNLGEPVIHALTGIFTMKNIYKSC